VRAGQSWIGAALFAVLTMSIGACAQASTVAGHRPLATGMSLSNISCPSANVCFAVGQDQAGVPVIFKSSTGASSWSPQAIPSDIPGGYWMSLSCFSTMRCVGDIATWLTLNPSVLYTAVITTTDGGTTWKSQHFNTAASIAHVNELSCTGLATCFGVGDFAAIMRTSDFGASWTALPATGLPKPPTCSGCAASGMDAVSCPPESGTCLVVGHNTHQAFEFGRTAANGTRLVGIARLSGVHLRGYFALSCSTSRACMVFDYIGSRVLVTTDQGFHWSDRPLPPVVSHVLTARCTTVEVCTAIVQVGRSEAFRSATTYDDAVSWHIDSYPLVGATDMSCPTLNRCFTIGGDSAYWRVGMHASWVTTPVS